MTTAIVGIVVTALVGAIVGIVQELRRRNEAAAALRASNDLDALRIKYKELSETFQQRNKDAAEQDRRNNATIAQRDVLIAQFEKKIASAGTMGELRDWFKLMYARPSAAAPAKPATAGVPKVPAPGGPTGRTD